MSWISGICSLVKSVAVKAVKVVGKALTKVAEVGEKVIKGVKAIWPRIKPFLEKVAPKLYKIPKIGPILGAATQTLLALDKSPILRMIGDIAEKTLPIIARVGEKMKSWAEVKEMEMKNGKIHEAEQEKLNEEQRQSLLIYKMLLTHKILVSKVGLKIDENDVSDMESYLQLRAASRILERMQEKWNVPELKATDFTSEDAFVLAFTDKLLKGEAVLESEADQFAGLTEKLFGRPILAIVFDEMVKQWAADLKLDRNEEEHLLKKKIELEMGRDDLETFRELGLMDLKKENRYNEILNELKDVATKYESLKKSINHRQCYIEAAEGMLLVYEGDDALYTALEGKADLNRLVEAVKNQVETVANSILQCMEGGKEWESLADAERILIQDFSNIFRLAVEMRAKPLVDVIVGVS